MQDLKFSMMSIRVNACIFINGLVTETGQPNNLWIGTKSRYFREMKEVCQPIRSVKFVNTLGPSSPNNLLKRGL